MSVSYYDRYNDRNREAFRQGERDGERGYQAHRYDYDSFTERGAAYQDGYRHEQWRLEIREEERRKEEAAERRAAERRHYELDLQRQQEERDYHEHVEQEDYRWLEYCEIALECEVLVSGV